MATFSNKKVWHSHLKYASPIVLRFTSDALESQYVKGSKIVFFDTRDESDPEGTYLVIESDTIEKQIAQTPKNTWVKVTALGGGKDDSQPASLVIEAADNQEYSPPPTTRGSSGGGSTTKSSGNERHGPGNILDAYKEAVEVAVNNFPGAADDNGVLTDFGHRHANSLFIQFYKTGRFVPLYEGQPLESQYGAATEPPVSQEDLDAIQVYLDEMDWSGEAHDGTPLPDMRNSIKARLNDNAFDGDAIRVALSWLGTELAYQDERNDPVNKDLPF